MAERPAQYRNVENPEGSGGASVAAARDPQELLHRIEFLKHRRPIRFGEALLDLGAITPLQLDHALQIQQKHPTVSLGVILQRSGRIDEETLRAALALHLGIPAVDLNEWPLEPDILISMHASVLRRHELLPIWRNGNTLIVALSDVLDQDALDAMRLNTPLTVQLVYAPAATIRHKLEQHCWSDVAATVSDDDLERGIDEYASIVETGTAHNLRADDNVIVRLADQIIAEAHHARASDIHIEPMPEREKTVVRIRVDGQMSEQRRIPWAYRDALVSRYKVMANLNIAEHRIPQDGKIRFLKTGSGPIELRVAVLPTAGGAEDIVLRILDQNHALPLTALGLGEPVEEKLRELIAKPYGILLACGPTGSGKTTSLHAILKHLNDGSRKIWTVEDPVEILQTGLRQVQVNGAAGLTFAKALRAFLRADPDVVMVGEIRDVETAKTALEASLTGHLVLSTLHTNNAPESVARLLEMGMNPFNFSDALLGILAQRLVRCLCPDCREPVADPEALLAHLKSEYVTASSGDEEAQSTRFDALRNQLDSQDSLTPCRPRGCASCSNTGYRSRVGLFELMPATPELKRLIIDGASAAQLFDLALEQGMTTLKQDGIEKIMRGMTDLTQVLTVSQR